MQPNLESRDLESCEAHSLPEISKRGRPHTNGRVHELFATEFSRLVDTERPSAKDRKMLKRIAETMFFHGFSVTEISATLSVPKSTICLWRNKLDDCKKAEIEQNVINLCTSAMSEFLLAAMQCMSRVANHASQPEYVSKHSPEQVAKLLEVVGNQALRLVEAKHRAELAKFELELSHGFRQ